MARGSRRVGSVAFLLALALRLLNVRFAAIAPEDELYHWKRMEFSARHFPQVLERDPDRGVSGAFCPWPPLYDLTAGGIARLFGMKSVMFIPPVFGAIAVGLAAMWVTANFGLLSGSAAAVALAASPFIVTQSWVGEIDHHYLEWPLVFGIMIARQWRRAALAMVAAIFVQSALIIACGLSLLLFWLNGERKASAAFFASAAVVALYRLTRAPDYPNTAWFLGWPHVALLVAAGVALLIRPRFLGLACGGLIALAAPLAQGLSFFGGDRWLSTVDEFQPMWRSTPDDLISQVVGLSAGAILAWVGGLLCVDRLQPVRRPTEVGPHTEARQSIFLFAIVFLILTITSRRFWSISIPLLAIAGAIAAAWFANRRVRVMAAAAVALIPAIQLGMWMRYPNHPIKRDQVAWIEAAEFLRPLPPGRVLTQWAMGHTFDVTGKHAVIVDGFGSMPDPVVFERATAALVAGNERTMAHFCDELHVRYVAFSDPEFGLEHAQKILALPDLNMQSTWYWRAYHGNVSTPRFRLIYRSDPGFMRAAIVIWEYAGHA